MVSVNEGPNLNNSKFMISTVKTDWLNGMLLHLCVCDTNYHFLFCFLDRCVVFGKVVDGLDILEEIGKLGSEEGMPRKSVIIASSGQL